MENLNTLTSPFRQNDLSNDPFTIRMNAEDRNRFYQLYTFFLYTDDRNKRNFGQSTFIKHLKIVHSFVVRNDGHDLDRGLACGIQFGKDFIIVHTQRLKNFMHRSKSCLNSSFLKMGYAVTHSSSEKTGQFLQPMIQLYGEDLIHIRHWCIRFPVESKFIMNFSPSISPIGKENESEPSEIEEQSAYRFMLDVRSLMN